MGAARAKETFLDALELPQGEREAFVERACAGDPALLARVRELLAAHAQAPPILPGTLLGALAKQHATAVALGAAALRAGARVGPYELERELGEGGFGVVWSARQTGALRRRVALKLLKPGLSGGEVLRRFEAERALLARMQHPAIAVAHDAGTSEHGLPYVAMELVDGPPITAWARERRVPLRRRLELFAEVCRAVQHAHGKGVIHRDIKPSNVLVAQVDGAPRPKVIDFGIAKLVGPDPGEATPHTRTGYVLGTPAYISPEQIDGPADVDTRSDVYSLGVLLYELSCDRTPLATETLREAGWTEIQRQIREVDPPRPSACLQPAAAEAAGPERARLAARARAVRGDLDWIAMRCLEKQRERRYASAAELAAEVERHLRGEPVLAGPPGLGYRLGKLARRHRAAFAAAAVVLLALLAATLVSTAQAVRAGREARKFEEIARFLEAVLLGVDPAVAQGADRTLLRAILDRAVQRVEGEAGGDPLVEAPLRKLLGQAYYTLALYEPAAAQLERALALHERHLGALHAETLTVRNDLGSTYVALQRLDEGEPLLRAAWEGRRDTLGPEHRDTLISLNNVAQVLRERGELPEAERLLREVEQARARRLGPDHEDTITAVNNLASVIEEQGRTQEAIPLYERALEVQERARGELHPLTLKALNNLGFIYQEAGRPAEAEPLLRRALEVKREVLEPGHPSLLVSLNNLASVCRDLGRVDEAEACYAEALPLALERLGPEHQQTLILRLNYGKLLMAAQRPVEAEVQIAAAEAGLRALHGAEDRRARIAAEALQAARALLSAGEAAPAR